jgi:adenylosuccinate synthase
VDYISLPGWKACIQGCRNFQDLPEAAQNYVREIERLLEVPVWWIGVRDAMIQNKPENA